MLLNELLQELPFPVEIAGGADERMNADISGIAYDSRRVAAGYLFVAIPGLSVDGHAFAPQAVQQGAVAVIGERALELDPAVVQIIVPDSRRALAAVCGTFYGHPDRSLRLIGVTGTNGKTTTTTLIKWLLDHGGHKCGLIGTIVNMAGDEILPATHTTPESLELFQLLRQMVDEGCDYAVMEVSSHALSQGRVSACSFAAAVFTNLTQDHLDYHGSMGAYLQSEVTLFRQLNAYSGEHRYGVVNINDKHSEAFIANCAAPIFTYGSDEDGITMRLLYYTPDAKGTRFALTYDGELYRAAMPLIGKFNVYNALAAMVVAQQEGMQMPDILRCLAVAPQVPGRFELIDEGQNFTVVVDYAHTPDGLKNLLSSARKLKPRRLITVFGCGGNRDKGKRPIMGHIAGAFSDVVILTSDNPRLEDPMQIIAEIETGLQEVDNNYLKQENRATAIELALNMAEAGDMVVIAGKGHEDYQILGTEKVHFDDREIARDNLRARLHK